MNTRAMAAAILVRIKEHGAYSNVILPQATRDLRRPDQAFVYRLVTTALRHLRTIDAIITTATQRPLAELDTEVLAVLEIAVGEMMTDEQDSVYATVNESVEAAKQLGRRRASGLVNGVLRRLGREGMPELPGDKARTFSVPEWVLGKLTADHGKNTAGSLLEGLRAPSPRIAIRVRPGAKVPEGAEPIAGIEDAYHVTRLPESLDGIAITDGASSAVAQAMAIQPGESILDMAAAPGGKTMSLWDQALGDLRLVAMDHHERRIGSARKRLEDVGVTPNWVVADGAAAPFADGSFDAVLVDAPCTGLGTLRRRPEIAMRLKPKGLEALARQQRDLLQQAWRVTRPGGRIVYSVCTLFAAETLEVVADYPTRPPEGVPGQRWGSGVLLAPHLTGTDGMYVAVVDR